MKNGTAPLGELCDVRIGRTPSRNRSDFWGGDNAWVSIADISDSIVRRTKERITDLAIEKAGCRPVEPGTLLLSFKLSLGKVAVAGTRLFTNEAIAALPIRDPDLIDSRYLYYRLHSIDWAALGRRAVKGNCLNREILEEAEIVYPGLQEQRRIAEQLERADRLRHTRRYAVELTDTILPAAFIELFGDPEKNSLDWPDSELGELCEEVLDCPHSTPIYALTKTQHPCVRSSDIQSGRLDFSEAKYVEAREYQKRIARGKPMLGDVIYCREGARFGNAGRITNKTAMCLGQRMMLFRAKRKVAVGEFIWGFLSSRGAYRQATRALDGSASPHVNVGEIVTFRTPVPPLSLQQKFASMCERVEHLREVQREALRQAEHLFTSLLQNAFRD